MRYKIKFLLKCLIFMADIFCLTKNKKKEFIWRLVWILSVSPFVTKSAGVRMAAQLPSPKKRKASYEGALLRRRQLLQELWQLMIEGRPPPLQAGHLTPPRQVPARNPALSSFGDSVPSYKICVMYYPLKVSFCIINILGAFCAKPPHDCCVYIKQQ